jgi:SulP family sulfate permease
MLKNEFKGYNLSKFIKDILAGLTVAAVALPLALAFGVASGADAAAGLITAIVAGIVTGLLCGASYQISGPTGAMTAILITIVATYQIQGVFLACLMAGVLLLVAGIFKIGRLIQYIPRPVVTGFTSGIAIIIVLGQIDNFFGTTSKGITAFEKIASYGSLGFFPNLQAVFCALLVIAIMSFFPKKWNEKVPSSLLSIIIAGAVAYLFKFDVVKIGEIPRTLFHSTRFSFSTVSGGMILELLSPAFTIAALGMVESLLCGACASNMKKEAFNADQELIAQGIGNMVIPFFGGVPSTAAIARTSVAIKSGGVTRFTSAFQSIWLILCMLLLAPVMAQLPLSALAGVLMVTAWRMNEWHSIKYFFKNKMWGAISKFLITLIATVVFDLTIAIIIGVIFSLILLVSRIAKIEIEFSKMDNKRVLNKYNIEEKNEKTVAVYITGALFFANSQTVIKKIAELNNDYDKFIIEMRGIIYMDISAGQTVLEFLKDEKLLNKEICFSGTRKQVMKVLKTTGIYDFMGEKSFYQSADKVLADITAN